MSAEVDSLIQRITEELREVPGVIGIVLGGPEPKEPPNRIPISISAFITMNHKDSR